MSNYVSPGDDEPDRLNKLMTQAPDLSPAELAELLHDAETYLRDADPADERWLNIQALARELMRVREEKLPRVNYEPQTAVQTLAAVTAERDAARAELTVYKDELDKCQASLDAARAECERLRNEAGTAAKASVLVEGAMADTIADLRTLLRECWECANEYNHSLDDKLLARIDAALK